MSDQEDDGRKASRSRSRSFSTSDQRESLPSTSVDSSTAESQQSGDIKEGIKVYVGGLSRDANNLMLPEELKGFMSQYGTVNHVWIARNPPGFGYVFFDRLDEAKSAIEQCDGKEFSGLTLKVELSKGSRDAVTRSNRGEGIKVYCGHLPRDVNQLVSTEDIMELFSRFGNVNHSWIARNPPGFAYVFFDNLGDAKAACESLDGSIFKDCTISVQLATEKKSRFNNNAGRYEEKYRPPYGDYNPRNSRGYNDSRMSRNDDSGNFDPRNDRYAAPRYDRPSNSDSRYGDDRGYSNQGRNGDDRGNDKYPYHDSRTSYNGRF